MKRIIDLIRDVLRSDQSVISLNNNVPYDRPIPFSPHGCTWVGKEKGLPPPPIIWYGDASDPPEKMIDTKARH
ncbi:hypothetical protein [Ectopseudomonas composti]|uniref:hypothetical protein n=1 Tax=Ectopseudomonas composti TaxID=658457 RepID=UPI0012E3E7EE|nr:hypothetical protein [Pseudomonas composti]